ncbi:phenylalanine--tRNA ligase subunit beta, partial [bacterium]|nr:phenylalanine--tRNA ligase subunit beta [bacterium]
MLDVAILPNRGDSQSILGLAREISVILDRPLTLPPRGYTVTPVALDYSITVTAPDLCPVYLLRGITQVKNGIAPLHLRRRLALAGLRSIDRIVDITNYVMLETGQPLHAFDRAALVGMHLTVDNARNGEMVQTLDNEVRELTEQIPVIRDGQGVVALAGVMGAQRGSVGAETSDLLIEAAYFAPTRIRKSKGILGLRTESAIRFEKGVDPDAVAFAQDRALYLLETLAEGKVVGGPIEYRDATHPIVVRGTLPLNPEKINRLLGTSYTETDMKSVLNRLGFESVGDEVVIPSWRRHDIKDWPCLAEEVARILGYDPIPEILDFRMVPQEKPSRLAELSATTETFWINQGFQQIQTFTMVAPDDFKATKVPMPSDWLQIQNPLTQSESVLRRYLMPSMLRAVSHNLKHQNGDLQFFEIGKVFYLAQEGEIREHLVCGAICTGSGWISPYSDNDKAVSEPSFFRMKGWAEELLGQLQISGATVTPSTYPQYHPFMSVDIRIDTKVVGNVGFLHPEILENYDIRQPVGYVGLNLSGLATLEVCLPSFKSFGRFPHTRRDVALLAPRHVGYADIIAAIDAHLPSDVSQYFLFDHFESDKLGVDKKSLAFGFIYSHLDKTLSD